jgi:ribosomal protein S18 acetylase RimI-like enzyme
MTTTLSATTVPIKTATASESEQAIAVLFLAFSSDPAVRWTFPDPHQYQASFPSFVRAFAGQAFDQGTAYYTDGYEGAALWLPPGVQPDEEAMVELLQRSVPEQLRGEAFAVLEQMGSYHPSEPHWYLPLIGVDPLQQGKGYGSVLMQHALRVCDAENRLAYLESSNARNIPLYERHGFELLGTIQVGTSPSIFPMLRQPR